MLELNLRIKPRKRLEREKPDTLAVPEAPNMADRLEDCRQFRLLNVLDDYNREGLDQYIIESTEEAQEFATKWPWTYNNERHNMGIVGITRAQKLKMAA